jgi:transposase-like protein
MLRTGPDEPSERAVAALWPDVPAQRCTVHKHRNLLAHAPDALCPSTDT